MVQENKHRKVLFLQGGGALGAYECGAYKALEEKGLRFDAVVGVSIGAVNGAIIAGNPEGKRIEALEGFWREASVRLPLMPNEALRRTASASYSLVFGNPRLFSPRWLNPWQTMLSRAGWTSFYDLSPMKRQLGKYVDFHHLAGKELRLFLAAVNVKTGKMELFDSFAEQLTADHVLASGALPPGFPWVTINGNAYWDGALISNTPLREVLERIATECVLDGLPQAPRMEVYLIDVFPREGRLPTNLGEVVERHKDILYAAKVESDVAQCALMSQTLTLVNELLAQLPPEVAQRITRDPRFVEFLCNTCAVDVVRISHIGEGREEFHFKDYDFSRESIQEHIEAGYQDGLAALERVPQTPIAAQGSQPSRRKAPGQKNRRVRERVGDG